MTAFFVGCLLDFDYGFNWQELLKRAGWEISDANWKRYVEEYDCSLPQRGRPAPPELEIPLMGPQTNEDRSTREVHQKDWLARMKMKERTGTLSFIAIEILETYVAHDIRHNLESFIWLLLWVVLRYTHTTCWPPNRLYGEVFGRQTEKDNAVFKTHFLRTKMKWEVVRNKPLTTLVRKFKDMVFLQNPPDGGPDPQPAIPLTYEKVLDLFDKALADPDWPQNDRALSLKITSKTEPSVSQVLTGSRGGEAPDHPDPLSLPAHKRVHIYRPSGGNFLDPEIASASNANSDTRL